jgi:leucine dehydrogenase
MRRFGKFVNSLGGKYITAEDVGISTADMSWVNMETNHVVGLPGKSGDPSPVTAYGVYMGMKAAAKVQFGSDSLLEKKLLFRGLDMWVNILLNILQKKALSVFISDIHEDTLKRVASTYKADCCWFDDIYTIDMDIYAPCALGATVNDDTLAKLKCSIIAGAANNQLKNEAVHGEVVRDKGILYIPDFMINAGGVINCYAEVKGFTAEWAMTKAEEIYNRTLSIVNRSKESKYQRIKLQIQWPKSE